MDKQKRKTTELVVPASRPPSDRVSRLTQPRKYTTPRTNIRSNSTENLRLSYHSTFGRSRSVCNIETPARTPNGRFFAISTPSSLQTDKKIVNDQQIRVLKVLRHHLESDFLPGGLRTMNTKQFNEIIKFFAKAICKNKFQIRDNNVDDIKRFVSLMNYPYSINKSLFQTPTTNVAFDRIVALLDWLCDFIWIDGISSVETLFENVDVLSDDCHDFTNSENLETFVKGAKDHYMLFNYKETEFEAFQARLSSTYIYQRNGITDIDAHTAKLEIECEELSNNQFSFQKDNLLQRQKKESQRLASEVNQLKATVEEYELEFQDRSIELTKIMERNALLKKKKSEVQRIIENQRFSSTDREQIVRDLDQKKHLAYEKQAIVDSLQAISGDHQVKLARMKKQKVSTIYAFNTLVRKLFHTEGVVDFDGIEMQQMVLRENDNIDRISEVLELNKTIKNIIDKLRQGIQVLLTESQLKLTSHGNQLNKIEDELRTTKNTIHSLEIQIKKTENEIFDMNYASERKQQQIQMKINDLSEKCTKNKSEFEYTKKHCETLDEENGKILQGIELQANQLIKKKERRLAATNQALSALEQLAPELKSVLDNFK